MAKVLNGNESDSTWNLMTIEELKKQLGDKIGTYILIADSKFVNMKIMVLSQLDILNLRM